MALCRKSGFQYQTWQGICGTELNVQKIINFIMLLVGDLIDEDRFNVMLQSLNHSMSAGLLLNKKINLFRRKDG